MNEARARACTRPAPCARVCVRACKASLRACVRMCEPQCVCGRSAQRCLPCPKHLIRRVVAAPDTNKPPLWARVCADSVAQGGFAVPRRQRMKLPLRVKGAALVQVYGFRWPCQCTSYPPLLGPCSDRARTVLGPPRTVLCLLVRLRLLDLQLHLPQPRFELTTLHTARILQLVHLCQPPQLIARREVPEHAARVRLSAHQLSKLRDFTLHDFDV